MSYEKETDFVELQITFHIIKIINTSMLTFPQLFVKTR